MPATAEEIATLNTIRALEGRPPLAPHELEALAYDRPAAQATVTEAEALACLGSRQQRTADQAPPAPAPAPGAPPPPTSRPHQVPATPAPHAASGLAGLIVGGAQLSDHERGELEQMDLEYKADGRGPLTADRAASIVAKWRARAA